MEGWFKGTLISFDKRLDYLFCSNKESIIKLQYSIKFFLVNYSYQFFERHPYLLQDLSHNCWPSCEQPHPTVILLDNQIKTTTLPPTSITNRYGHHTIWDITDMGITQYGIRAISQQLNIFIKENANSYKFSRFPKIISEKLQTNLSWNVYNVI